MGSKGEIKKIRKVSKNKFLGYCVQCECIIAMNDRIDAENYKCPKCGKNALLSILKDSKSPKEKEVTPINLGEIEATIKETNKIKLTECTDTNDMEFIMDTHSSDHDE